MTPAPAGPPRPRIVVVTGAPGSGKTTLGVALSRALQIPFLGRDDVRRALFLTTGAWSDRPGPVPTAAEADEAFLRLVEAGAALGVSRVVEHVVRDDDVLARLTAAGDCVVVITECRDALERFAARHAADRLLNRAPVLDALGFATMEDLTAAAVARMRSVAREMRTDFDLPVLTVRTDDGYDPGLEAILAFATAGTGVGPART